MLLFLPGLLPVVDVSGKWSGTIELTGPEGTRTNPAFAVLKQDEGVVTGIGGPSEAERCPIRNGKIECAKLTLEADVAGAPAHFVLTVERDRLFGEIRSASGEHVGKLDIKRVDVRSEAPKAPVRKSTKCSCS